MTQTCDAALRCCEPSDNLSERVSSASRPWLTMESKTTDGGGGGDTSIFVSLHIRHCIGVRKKKVSKQKLIS